MDTTSATRAILDIICQLPACPLLYSITDALIESAEDCRVRKELLDFLRKPSGGRVAAYIALSLSEMYEKSPGEVTEAVLNALDHSSPEVRMWAADSLLDIFDLAPDTWKAPETRARIIGAWKESDVQTLWGAILRRLEAHQEAHQFLDRLIKADDIEGALSLAASANMVDKVMELLPVALRDSCEDTRVRALSVIGHLGLSEYYIDEILNASTDPSPDVREETSFLLAELSHSNDKAYQQLLEMIEDDSSGAAYIAAENGHLDPKLIDALLLVAARWNNDNSEYLIEILAERPETASVIAKCQPQSPEAAMWYTKLFSKVVVRAVEEALGPLKE